MNTDDPLHKLAKRELDILYYWYCVAKGDGLLPDDNTDAHDVLARRIESVLGCAPAIWPED